MPNGMLQGASGGTHACAAGRDDRGRSRSPIPFPNIMSKNKRWADWPDCEDFSLGTSNIIVRHYPYFTCTVNVDSLATWNGASARSLGLRAYVPTGRNIFLSPLPKRLKCSSPPLFLGEDGGWNIAMARSFRG